MSIYSSNCCIVTALMDGTQFEADAMGVFVNTHILHQYINTEQCQSEQSIPILKWLNLTAVTAAMRYT
ncbi:MAG: hypothetical protein F6J86_31775 [Symploca sp. SIO1B1]|nr:hypothetical protein [Symploca sp. SIO1B1]